MASRASEAFGVSTRANAVLVGFAIATAEALTTSNKTGSPEVQPSNQEQPDSKRFATEGRRPKDVDEDQWKGNPPAGSTHGAGQPRPARPASPARCIGHIMPKRMAG